MRALVTGGGGFLGTRVVQMLSDRGDEVTVLGRSRYAHHEKAGIRTIQADLRKAHEVESACAGMDVVFHIGGLTGVWGRRTDFRQTNIGGTQNVIDACRRQRVRRLVFTSSPSVVFGLEELCGIDESHPYPDRYVAAYPETKAEAERRVLRANGPDLATIALRPHLIWGPGDRNLIPRVVARARVGKLRRVGDGTNLVDITYIDNAAEAHLLAADRLEPASACAGRAYFISQGEPVVFWSWLNGFLRRIGCPVVSRTMPFERAYRIGALLECVHRCLRIRKEPLMTRFVALQLAKSHYFNISAAKRDFGYTIRISTEEGVRRLAESMTGEARGPLHSGVKGPETTEQRRTATRSAL